MDGENSNNISVLSKCSGWYVNICFKYYNNNNEIYSFARGNSKPVVKIFFTRN